MSLKDTAARLAVLKAARDAIDAEYEATRRTVLDELREARETLGVKSVAAALPDGTPVATVTLSEPKPGISIDNAAFLGWVKANHPDEVVYAVREPFRRKVMDALKVDGDRVVNTATGEVVEWAAVREAGPHASFSLRFTAGGRDAIAAAFRDRNLLGNLAPRELEGGDDA